MNNKINWQAYLDGSLTESQKQEAETILQNDPQAQAELQGLKAFRSQLKEAALKEPIPHAKLQQSLRKLVKQESKPFWNNPRLLAPLAIGTCLIAAALIYAPQVPIQASASTIDLRKSPLVGTTHLHNPESAAEWVVSTLHDSAPVVSLSQLKGAEFTGADCGHCWLAYKFSYQDQDYVIYGRHEDDPFQGFARQKIEGKTFYKLSDGVGWRCVDDMTYVVKGGTPQGQLSIAVAACKETTKLIQDK